MKKVLTYGVILGLSLLFTGCFASAGNAQNSLANTGNSAKSAKEFNAKSRPMSEMSITDKSAYDSLVTPKWN